jgi:glycosyltransferase involved in cell wall biosynthesis
MQKNLLELIENDTIRNEIKQNGWNHVKEQFSYKRLVIDIDNLYKKLLNK